MVRLSPYTCSTLSTRTPQGCILSPLLNTLYTHHCTPTHTTKNIIKFAGDAIVVGLISSGDKAVCRCDVQKLAELCSENHLALNASKAKELITDFLKHRTEYKPLYINRNCVEKVPVFRFLSALNTEDLS